MSHPMEGYGKGEPVTVEFDVLIQEFSPLSWEANFIGYGGPTIRGQTFDQLMHLVYDEAAKKTRECKQQSFEVKIKWGGVT